MKDESVSRSISEFVKLIEDLTTYTLNIFPDPLDKGDSYPTDLIMVTIQNLTEVEKALDVFKKWIRARKDVYSCGKTFLETLYRIRDEKGDFSTKISLFLIPAFGELVKSVDADQKYYSKVTQFLPAIEKATRGSKSMEQRTSVFHQVLGVDSRKYTSVAESYFKALADQKLDEAAASFKIVCANYEKLRERMKDVNIQK